MISGPGYVESEADCAIAARNSTRLILEHDHHVVTDSIGGPEDIDAYYACSLRAPLGPVRAQAAEVEALLFDDNPVRQRLAGDTAKVAATMCNAEFSQALLTNYKRETPLDLTPDDSQFTAHRSTMISRMWAYDGSPLFTAVHQTSCAGSIGSFDFSPENTAMHYDLNGVLEVGICGEVLKVEEWPNQRTAIVETLGLHDDMYAVARALFSLCKRTTFAYH